MLIEAIFIAVKGGEQLECLLTVEQMSTRGLDRPWTIIQLFKGNSDSCYSTDEPWELHTMNNEPVPNLHASSL